MNNAKMGYIEKKRIFFIVVNPLGKMMQLEIQLDDDLAQKLAYIQEQTNQDLSEAIKQAIEQYYKQINSTNKPPLEIFKELGLVGCFKDDADLSVSYKRKMTDYLKAKQEQNRL